MQSRDDLQAKLASALAALEVARAALVDVKVRVSYIGHPQEPWRGNPERTYFLGESGPDWSVACASVEKALAAIEAIKP